MFERFLPFWTRKDTVIWLQGEKEFFQKKTEGHVRLQYARKMKRELVRNVDFFKHDIAFCGYCLPSGSLATMSWCDVSNVSNVSKVSP